MVAEPLNPAMAPTTQAAPKLGRSMEAILPLLGDGGNIAV